MNALSDGQYVKPEEVKELEKNIEVAMCSLEENERYSMLRATYNHTITSTFQMKKLLSHTIVTLK